MTNNKAPVIIQSLQIGLNILGILGKEKRPLKFTDIQHQSGMTKSNLYKYLNTLCQSGMLFRDPYTNTYTLGHKLVELGSVAMGNTSFVEHAMPYFKDINQQTNLTALLAIPTVKGPLVAHIYSADYGINIGAQIGTNLPLTSATGLLFSAFEKNEHLKKWEQSYKENWTTEQIAQFQFEQQQVLCNFFATKTEPLVEHVSSFSIPILNYNEDLIGAITVVGYTNLVPNSLEHPTSQLVLNIASHLSEYYGFFKKG